MYQNKRILIVSWYHKPDQDPNSSINKGVRVSFVDLTSLNNIRYRHALLVEPMIKDGRADYKPVTIHAGGLVWVGDYLYIPDTTRGFRVFDLTRILQVQTSDNSLGGYIASLNAYHAFGYKYIIPQVNLYTHCPNSCCVRFSFASLNISTNPAALLSGEYSSSHDGGRLHIWPLDLATGRLITTNNTVIASTAFFPGVRKMQGAAQVGNNFWISSSQPKTSSPTSPGSLYRGSLNQAIATFRYPYPPEDMYYASSGSALWSHNENPNQRFVFRIDPTTRGSSCP
jgi:hypothetical protein